MKLKYKDKPDAWAMLYLHDWDVDGKVYPEIHGLYETWQEAEKIRKEKINPHKYWVHKTSWPEGF